MTEYLPLLLNGGAIGVLTGVFWAIVRGHLVPKQVMEDRVKEAYKQADMWEQTSKFFQAALEKKDQVATAQLETAKTLDGLITALRSTAAGDHP
jgi:hypothetical protein